MSLKSDLYSHLKADSGVSALVGTRVYPMKAPQNVVKPYITYQAISDNSDQCLGGSTFQRVTRFQVDCWSTTYSEADAIKEAVLSSLTGFKSSHSVSAMDDYEPDTGLYRQLIDFKLKG